MIFDLSKDRVKGVIFKEPYVKKGGIIFIIYLYASVHLNVISLKLILWTLSSVSDIDFFIDFSIYVFICLTFFRVWMVYLKLSDNMFLSYFSLVFCRKSFFVNLTLSNLLEMFFKCVWDADALSIVCVSVWN